MNVYRFCNALHIFHNISCFMFDSIEQLVREVYLQTQNSPFHFIYLFILFVLLFKIIPSSPPLHPLFPAFLSIFFLSFCHKFYVNLTVLKVWIFSIKHLNSALVTNALVSKSCYWEVSWKHWEQIPIPMFTKWQTTRLWGMMGVNLFPG